MLVRLTMSVPSEVVTRWIKEKLESAGDHMPSFPFSSSARSRQSRIIAAIGFLVAFGFIAYILIKNIEAKI